MLATTTIPNPEMGNAMAYGGVQLLDGKTTPGFLFGRCDVITKANAAKYVPWPVRNKSAMKVASSRAARRRTSSPCRATASSKSATTGVPSTGGDPLRTA